MTNETKKIKALIEGLTEEHALLRIHNSCIKWPRSLVPKDIKSGDEIAITIEDPEQSEKETEAKYQAMKKILKEIIN